MAAREIDPRLEQLYNNGAKVYSISKLNSLDGCLREAYYSYRDPNKPSRMSSIYGIMGGEIHEVLEDIYNDVGTPDQLLPAMLQELDNATLCGIEFPKDFKGEDTIRDNWVADMTHFCNHFEKLSGDNFITEELVLYQFGENRYMQGYIDLISIVDKENKIVDIYDFKTSAKFKKADLVHHGRQLVFYAMAMENLGYTVRNIAWIMLKYVEISYMGYSRSNAKSKSKITKIVQRGKIAKELSSVVESMLYELGYGEIDIELMIDEFRKTNEFTSLPANVANQFSVKQYIAYYDYNAETQAETLAYINKKADAFEELWDKDMADWLPKDITDSESFYCNNLCSHRDICTALQKYNTLRELQNIDDDDLF